MRWHITGDEEAALKAREALRKLDDEVSARWLDYEYEDSEEEAMVTMDDIAKSQGLIYLCPKAGSYGRADTALGMALSFNKRTIFIGKPRTPYHQLPTVENYATLKDFIASREDETNSE